GAVVVGEGVDPFAVLGFEHVGGHALVGVTQGQGQGPAVPEGEGVDDVVFVGGQFGACQLQQGDGGVLVGVICDQASDAAFERADVQRESGAAQLVVAVHVGVPQVGDLGHVVGVAVVDENAGGCGDGHQRRSSLAWVANVEDGPRAGAASE